MGAESTKAALNRYYEKQARELSRVKRTNQKPEFQFRYHIAVPWFRVNGFDVDVVESKAVYSHAAGRFLEGQAEAGFSDIVGVTSYFGVGVWCELKAPGKRSTLKPHQRDFLLSKINKYAFALCADSIHGPNGIETVYKEWMRLRQTGMLMQSKTYLIGQLPKVKELTDNLADITG